MVPSSLPRLLSLFALVHRGNRRDSPDLFLLLLEGHLQDRVLGLEGADLPTQSVDNCLWVNVHAANTITYNGRMGSNDTGAHGGMPVKKKVIPVYTEDGEVAHPAVRLIDNVMKGMRVCCGKKKV